ncbi:hypothetical protein ACIBSV_07335 [Embleya sp. NPDC050154]|uniref:hypothetical protein n=1 Tax=Embleya sp. NPDC050154 TaxID=3363988 RepID=UPI00379CE1C1
MIRHGRGDAGQVFLVGLASVGLASATVGIAVAAAFLNAYGPATWWRSVCVVVLALASMAMVLATTTVVWSCPSGGAVVGGLVVFFAMFVTIQHASNAVGDTALAKRGVSTTCLVLDVRARTETSTSTDANGHTTTTTRTYNDHRLNCPEGGPTNMTTSRAAAKKGQSLRIRYDPKGRLDTVPERRVARPGASLRKAERSFTVVVFAALLIPQIGARHTRPRRPSPHPQ